MADSFCPLSARTTARQKVRVARRKATLIHSTGKYSKYQDLCNIVQKKCGMTESQVQKELGKFCFLIFFVTFKIFLQKSFWKHVQKGWWPNGNLPISQLWHWVGNLNFWPKPYLGSLLPSLYLNKINNIYNTLKHFKSLKKKHCPMLF